MMAEERLQKVIARSGLCSRREADQMIADGRVTVDGQPAAIGQKVDPETVHIKVDGRRLKPPQASRYLLLYKPRGVMTTCDDPEGRPTVLDIVRSQIRERVFPVGRLDYHSEGLLMLTNDGWLADRIAHPRHGLIREYLVKVRGDLSEDEQRRLMEGTVVDGAKVKPRSVRRDGGRRGGTSSWWRVEVTEGRTHEVRELFFHVGHPVQRLRRTAIGPLRDDSLRAGEFRTLSASEIEALRTATSARPRRGRQGKVRQRTPKPSKRRSGRDR
jgi:pseudouridine synthase